MRAAHLLHGFVAVAAVAVVMTTAACGSSDDGGPDASDTTEAAIAANQFLERYVNADGAVVREDQGGDVVSEGQAYGMLIAEIAGQPDVARTIWDWTSANLTRPDGLLAFHANADGSVIDDSAASDADTLAAFALLRYDGSDASALHADGRQLADAVLEHETAPSESGGLVLVAGDWAVGPPAVVNPSYWMPGVFDDLAERTGDGRWTQLADTSVSLVDDATSGASSLPSDWGQLSGSTVEPTPSQGGSVGVQYSLDAQRVPLWFAAACSDRARELSAGWWDLLASPSSSSAIALNLDGSVLNGETSPVPMLASAAAARAAGDDDQAATLTADAESKAHSSEPTYYGDAWVVLAQALADGSLTDCGA